jgi:K+/H+ antiporter YhaU regulatory subunit KhtT
MRAQRLARLYLTHFGQVDEADAHLATVVSLLSQFAERVRQKMIQGASRQEIIQCLTESEEDAQAVGAAANKAETGSSGFGSLSTYVDGVMRYWSKRL